MSSVGIFVSVLSKKDVFQAQKQRRYYMHQYFTKLNLQSTELFYFSHQVSQEEKFEMATENPLIEANKTG